MPNEPEKHVALDQRFAALPFECVAEDRPRGAKLSFATVRELKLDVVVELIDALGGMKQIFIGLDAGEKAWLNVPGNLSTHMLFGKLRVFSFYSDSGQFGASQAHTAVVASILAIFEKSRMRKIFYILTALLCFYGMLISGTRGAFAIPVVGFFTYLLLIKNFKIVIAGSTVLAVVFFILKFTFIGQGNSQISRLRSSLDPKDASLQVRITNQQKLAEYLNVHWLGGGVSSGGYWGQRFSPNTRAGLPQRDGCGECADGYHRDGFLGGVIQPRRAAAEAEDLGLREVIRRVE